MTNLKGKKVVVRGIQSGVFFGTLESIDGQTVLGDGECDSQFLFDISPDGNEEKLADEIQRTEVIGNVHDNPELMEEV